MCIRASEISLFFSNTYEYYFVDTKYIYCFFFNPPCYFNKVYRSNRDHPCIS